MKTSNKLLIALAISLIIIPIVVIAVNVKMNYTDAKTMVAESKSVNSFATPSDGYTSTEIAKPFTAINVNNAKGMFLNIRLIKDSKSGIKISEEDKDAVSFKIDQNGVLQLTVKEMVKGASSYLSLIIYAPNFNQLSMAKGKGLDLTANADSFLLNVFSLNDVVINSNSKTKSLITVAENVNNFSIGDNKIATLDLKLKNSNFTSVWSSYKLIKVTTEGHSDIEISGQDPDKNKFQIDNLYIKTNGKSDLKVENIKVNKSSGSLSDSTSVSMSASVLKTMFNK